MNSLELFRVPAKGFTSENAAGNTPFLLATLLSTVGTPKKMKQEFLKGKRKCQFMVIILMHVDEAETGLVIFYATYILC